ncbi:MAG: RNA polymerase subunit sigma-70 [Planctomycetota bacterium]|nr:MAG: RNA polymerase subunit sigma-70 [Planctomycetota bacterium]
MSGQPASDATQILAGAGSEDPSVVAAKLLPLVYDELRRLAAGYLRRERKGHTLDPTALVHEAFMRLVDQSRVDWQGKTHFYAVCAEAMRRILIDHARARRRTKRGKDWRRVAFDQVVSELALLDVDLLDFRDALAKLARLDARQARVVELRLFAGLSMEEICTVLGVSKRTVEGDWTCARAWLRGELGPEGGS